MLRKHSDINTFIYPPGVVLDAFRKVYRDIRLENVNVSRLIHAALYCISCEYREAQRRRLTKQSQLLLIVSHRRRQIHEVVEIDGVILGLAELNSHPLGGARPQLDSHMLRSQLSDFVRAVRCGSRLGKALIL